MEYPAEWLNYGPVPQLQVSRFVQGPKGESFTVSEQSVESLGVSISTLEEYVGAIKGGMARILPDIEIVVEEDFENDQGLTVRRLDFVGSGGLIKGATIIYLHEGKLGFNAAYTLPAEDFDALGEMIDYSLSSFRVLEDDE